MLSFKELIFILFNLFVLIENTDSVSYTVGSYPDHLKYGINDAECGQSTINSFQVEISLDYSQCFKKKYPPQKLLVKNEDIFHAVNPKERISGGTATEHLEAPWAVLIYYLGTNNVAVYCEGVLITLEWVLTVARCNPPLAPRHRLVYAGSHIALKGIERKAALWKPANIFRREQVGYDLALVKLNEPYNRTLDKVQYTLNTVCLPKRDEVHSQPENAELFSWGEIDREGTRSEYLRKADIPLKGSSCGHKHLICANFERGTAAPRPCWADRGAGLVQYDKGGLGKEGERRAVLAGIFLNTEANMTYRPIHPEPCTQDITWAEFYRVSDVVNWILETIKTN